MHHPIHRNIHVNSCICWTFGRSDERTTAWSIHSVYMLIKYLFVVILNHEQHIRSHINFLSSVLLPHSFIVYFSHKTKTLLCCLLVVSLYDIIICCCCFVVVLSVCFIVAFFSFVIFYNLYFCRRFFWKIKCFSSLAE